MLGNTQNRPLCYVKEKADGDYVYSFSTEKESSTQRTLHAAVSTHKGANGELFLNNIVSNSNELVKDEADKKNHSLVLLNDSVWR